MQGSRKTNEKITIGALWNAKLNVKIHSLFYVKFPGLNENISVNFSFLRCIFLKNAKINIAPLFYVEFSWHGFMKIVAGTTSIFLLGFSLFSKHSDNYRNKEVCVEIQYCFIQTLLAIDFFRHWNWASEFHLDFSHVFR